MLRLAAVALALAASSAALAATDEAAVLAAARAASNEYRIRFGLLAGNLQSPDIPTRLASLRELGYLQDPQAVPLILPFTEKGKRTKDELILAVTVLGRMGYQTALPHIRELAGHEDADIRKAAQSALHQIGSIVAADLLPRAQDPADSLRLDALAGLGRMQQAEAAAVLVKGMDHHDPLVRQAACIGLGLLGDRVQGERLRIALTDANPGVRRYAAEAIARLNYTPALPDLLMALEGNIAGAHIRHALQVMTGEDFGFDPSAPLAVRQQAVDRAFAWLAARPELKQ